MVDSRGGRCSAYLYWVGLCMEHIQPADPVALPGRAMVVQSAVHNIHDSARSTWTQRCIWRSLGRTARPPGGSDGCSVVFWDRFDGGWHWTGTEAIRSGFPWNGRHRRHRMRTRLHIAGEHTREVVSGPAWNGHRNGHYGIRRWRVSRRV